MAINGTITKAGKTKNGQGLLREGFEYGLSEYRSHRKIIHQTGILFFSKIVGLLIGFAIKIVQTRSLGPSDYGLFAFFISVTGFSVLFFRFGLFSSLRVLLADNNDPRRERELFGVGFLIAMFAGLCFSVFIFTASFFIDDIFKTNIGNILLLASPLCFILPFQYYNQAVSIGSNKVGYSALFGILSKSLFLAPLLILFLVANVTVSYAIYFYLLSFIVTSAVMIERFRPLFGNMGENLKTVWKKNREFGLHIYAGEVADQTTHQLDGLMIAYFVNMAQLGFYSLAYIISSPMVVLSSSLSAAMFKRFAARDSIPGKVIIYNTIWLLACVVFITVFAKTIVTLFFGTDFIKVFEYLIPIALVAFFQGMYQPYNLFLAAKGEKKIGHIAFITSPVNLIGNIVFIPIFGVMGAIATSLATAILWYFLLLKCYLKYTRKQ